MVRTLVRSWAPIYPLLLSYMILFYRKGKFASALCHKPICIGKFTLVPAKANRTILFEVNLFFDRVQCVLFMIIEYEISTN